MNFLQMISDKTPSPREIYRHFKGVDKLYEIIAIANNCENPKENFVIYKQLYDTKEFPKGSIWSRSLEDFIGYKEFLDGSKVKRFEKISK